MNNHKFIPIISVALAATLCLSACGNPKSPTSSSSASPDFPPSGSSSLEDMVTPEDMAGMVYDGADALTESTLTNINNSNANWTNLYGERVALVVVPSVAEDVSIDMVGEEYSGKMELTDKDSMLVINADTGDSILMIGSQSLLVGAGVMPNLEQGLDLDAAIFSKYLEIGDAYVAQQSPTAQGGDNTGIASSAGVNTNAEGEQDEMVSGPSEEDIAKGEEIYKNIDIVLSGKGMPGLIDITGIGGNQESFPQSVIKETGDGHIKYQVLKGSFEDCENCWFWYYNKVIGDDTVLDENGKTTFVQSFDPNNLNKHKSIAGYVNSPAEDSSSEQTYYRAECLGNIVVAASGAPEYAGTIDKTFAELGFPESSNIVY